MSLAGGGGVGQSGSGKCQAWQERLGETE